MVNLLPVIATALGIVSTLAGGLAYYRSVVRKGYASERDFGHLRRNYENLAQLTSQIDDRLLEVATASKILERLESRLDTIDRTILEMKIKLGSESRPH